MIVKITLWTQNGMAVKKYRVEGEKPMDALRWAVQEYVQQHGHPPSDCRLKVR